MATQNYIDYKGLSYSRLASFYQYGRNNGPEFKKSYATEFGKYVEWLIQCEFEEEKRPSEWFVCKDTISDPMIKKIDWEKPFDEQFILTKAGARSGTYKSFHAWLDLLIENEGKFPISEESVELGQNMLKNALKMQFFDLPMSEYLSNGTFSKELYWGSSGNEKKIELDFVSEVFIDDEPVTIAFDFKTAATPQAFYQLFKRKYFLQDRHAIEGLTSSGDYAPSSVYPYLVFVIMYKGELFLSQTASLKEEALDRSWEKYSTIVSDYKKWELDGKPDSGVMEHWDLGVY